MNDMIPWYFAWKYRDIMKIW